MAITYIDPPSGWMYGFPMVYDPLPGETVSEFLMRKGYPQENLAADGHPYWCRFWEEPEIEDIYKDGKFPTENEDEGV